MTGKSQAEGGADLVLRGARVITMNPTAPAADAVATNNGRIVAVGTSDEIGKLAGPDTEIVDLDGLTVIPGFNDTHAHMDREGLKAQRPSLEGAQSIADILQRVSDVAANTPPGEWIVTMPVGTPPCYFGGPETLAENRMPTRQELDSVAPDHPVCIAGVFANWGAPPGYTALNSRALELNGIRRDTEPRCSGIEIDRDESGEPTGVIIETNQRPFIEFDLLPAVPRFGLQERIDGIRHSMQIYNAVGTTSVYEGHGLSAQTVAAYRDLWEKGDLSVRVALTLSPAWRDIAEARTIMRDWLGHARGRGMGDPWFWITGVHIAYGGESAVADLAREDLPNTGWSGFVEQAVSQKDFRDYCLTAAEYDLRVHTIVGDDLQDLVPALVEVGERYPIGERRWVVEHIGRARQEDLETLRKLGVQVTTIPAYFVWKGGGWYADDPDFGESVVAHRAMLDLGIPVAAGTDNIPYDPFFTLWVMSTRHERHENRVLGPNQRISGAESLDLLTRQGARLTFEEDRKGILASGYYADIAVLSDDPTSMDPEKLRDLRCHLTIAGGKVVHRDL
ncbi:MAG: metal-dependent hydrolase [Chloroflexi bacterium]|nr:metal-dependent hydrolase [Chloroflexota bacterium]|tara:strand:+ start:129 stop:1817 length:1689 start_codon:yes stop_codon:yes gene_type:complete